MRHKWLAKMSLLIALLGVLFVVFGADALAQCAMCKTSAASSLEATTTRHLNFAVIMLLCPPVTIFCAFFFVAYRHGRAPGDDE